MRYELVPVIYSLVHCVPRCIGFHWQHETLSCVLISMIPNQLNFYLVPVIIELHAFTGRVNCLIMADNRVLRSMDYLTCPLCCEVFKNPKYLPCHHFFCEECLENEQKQSQIFCMKCEQQSVVPVGGVKELDNAFFVNHLINMFITEHKEKGDIEVKCNGCSRGDLTETFCPYCSLNM